MEMIRKRHLKDAPVRTILEHFLRPARRYNVRQLDRRLKVNEYFVAMDEANKLGISCVTIAMRQHNLNYSEILAWLWERKIASRDWCDYGIMFYFRDPNVAFEFKLRWYDGQGYQ